MAPAHGDMKPFGTKIKVNMYQLCARPFEEGGEEEEEKELFSF